MNLSESQPLKPWRRRERCPGLLSFHMLKLITLVLTSCAQAHPPSLKLRKGRPNEHLSGNCRRVLFCYNDIMQLSPLTKKAYRFLVTAIVCLIPLVYTKFFNTVTPGPSTYNYLDKLYIISWSLYLVAVIFALKAYFTARNTLTALTLLVVLAPILYLFVALVNLIELVRGGGL